MPQRSFILALAISSSTWGLLGHPSVALAAPACTSSTDCALGYSCVTSRWGCEATSCADGVDCPLECAEEKTECQPGTVCSTDSDCSPELMCVWNTVTTCGVDAICEMDAVCVEAPPHCIDSITKRCRPRYHSLCSTNKDCEEGFECVNERYCACTDEVNVPTTERCSCTEAGVNRCSPTLVSCVDATVCPVGWSCEMHPSAGCGAAAGGGGAPDDASGGFTAVPPPPTDACPPAEGICVPPDPAVYWTRLSTAVGGSGNDSVPGDGAGVPADAAGAGGTASTPLASTSTADAGGFCQIGTGAPARTAWLMFLALAGFAARRRSRSFAAPSGRDTRRQDEL
jgi:hypothetical protein